MGATSGRAHGAVGLGTVFLIIKLMLVSCHTSGMPRQASDGSECGFMQGVEELEISLAEVVYGSTSHSYAWTLPCTTVLVREA